jgi:UDP-N-acetylmuramyl pentapeptide phosphotransferase/UDP-N-acetylglucosamine-1-phosphate transferase
MSIPSIIAIADVKHLYDEPGARKSHSTNVPTLGGLAIFAGLFFSISFWTDFSMLPKLQYILAGLIVLFFIGIKDDIIALSASKKAIGQLVATIVVVIWGEVRITSFSGILGIYELNYIFSVLFSIFTIFIIINAYNLIDGINGLSGSFGIVAASTFGAWFFVFDNQSQNAIIAFSLVGALFAFLRFNVTPAKIFMGDTGSLILGFVLAIFAVEFIELNEANTTIYHLKSGPVFAISVLFIPLVDLLRVFSMRLLRGKSPFKADKSHIHHMMLKIGLNHTQATFLLSLISVFLITLSLSLDKLGNYFLLALLVILYIVLIWSIKKISERKKLQDAN